MGKTQFFSYVIFGISPSAPLQIQTCCCLNLRRACSCACGASKPSLPRRGDGQQLSQVPAFPSLPPRQPLGKRSSLSLCFPAVPIAPGRDSRCSEGPISSFRLVATSGSSVPVPPRPVTVHVHLQREGILGGH